MRAMIFFCISVLILTLSAAILPINGEEAVYSDTVRLHVIAASDSERDQALKLAVRDGILELTGNAIQACGSADEAEAALGEMISEIEERAEEILADAGEVCEVEAQLGYERYPTRSYEGVSLPAGRYLSLRVKIGEAAGKNWWCVLYPPLCVDSSRAEEKLSAAGFTPGQIKLLCESDNPRYVLKFRLLEVIEELLHRAADSIGGQQYRR
ncbi:MAG: stage II sporulation protein R [Clostridia bacterium]|nr:stage II sporulation protein R [Clostridia bacterium]